MDIAIVLIIVLIIVVVWRGPKTLPQLGKAFGQGVKEARNEIDTVKGSPESKDETPAPAPPAPPSTPPAAPPATPPAPPAPPAS